MTFRGFATITFYADDLAAARDWYTELLGLEPYFAFPEAPAAPAYIEFRVGDDEDELGFVDRKYAPAAATGTPGGAIMNWHVDDVAGTLATLLAMGATTSRSPRAATPASSPRRSSTRSATCSASCTTRTTWRFSPPGPRRPR